MAIKPKTWITVVPILQPMDPRDDEAVGTKIVPVGTFAERLLNLVHGLAKGKGHPKCLGRCGANYPDRWH